MDRYEKILQILREAQSWIKSSQIAMHLNISTRTVRSDIKVLKEKYGQYIIATSNTDGYKINEEYIKALEYKEKENNINQNGRLVILLKILIINDDGIDIFSLAEKLYVSEHTIESDITKLRKFIVRLDNSTIKIIRRGNIIKLITKDTIRNMLLYDIFTNVFDGIELNDFQKCFEDINLRKLYINLKEFFIENKLEFRYLSFLKLTLEIAILIEKEKNYRYTEVEVFEIGTESKILANIVNENIHEVYGITLTKSNKNYLELIFDRLFRLTWVEENYEQCLDMNEAIEEKIRVILEEVSTIAGVDLLKNTSYVNDFINHILMGIERKKIGVNSFNPLINNLKNEYQYIFSIAIIIANKLKNFNDDIYLNLNDISDIVAYLAMIIESNQQKNIQNNTKLAVVVPEGRANLHYISNYIEKIVNKIGIEVHRFLCIDDIKNSNEYTIIVSTNNSSLIYNNSLLVNKYFNKMDKIKVETIINKEVNLVKKNMFRTNSIKFFRKELFSKNNNIKSKKEAIKYLCNKLYDDGCIEKDYYDHVIKRENIIESNIDSSVALPNAFFYNGKKSGAAVFVSKDGILWGGNKVRLVIMLVIGKEDREECIRFASDLNRILLFDSIYEYALKCENGVQFRYMLEYLYLKEI